MPIQLTGCGNKPSQSQAAETTQESTAEASEESVESSTDESEPSSDAEPGTESTDEETKPASSEEPAEAQAEESKEPSQEASKESESASNATGPAAESASVAQAEITPEVTSAPTEALAPAEQPQAPEYDVTAISATMYVKNTVNLRQGPGSSYAKVGSLNKGDQVTVTGQAANGWYQLDSGAFVSNKYLDSTAPAATPATVPGTTVLPTDQTGVVIPVDTTTTVSTGADFLNYLNQQRSAAGLGTLTWDSDMAAVAQRRAQEITKGLDHSGNVEQYGEVIQQAISGSATEWYTNWYNSEAHRTSMFGKNYTRAGVGVYAVGNNYFVVCNFQGDPISAEELLEQLKPDNLIHAGGNASGTVNSFSTTGETLNPDNPDDAKIIEKIEEQDRLINEGVIEVPELKETEDGYFVIP